MPENVYATTRTFDALAGERFISIDANGGTVVVEVLHGPANWIPVKTYSADTAEFMNFGTFGRSVRFTVTGAATYAL